jgi:DNA-binding MarR family transcriptional regulator
MTLRRMPRKDTAALHKKEMLLLLYIGSRPVDEIVTQTDIAKALDEPLSSLNYHFTKLRKRGLLDERTRLTDRGIKALRYLKQWDKTFDRKLRAHKIQITIYLTKAPNNYSELSNTVLTPFTNGRYRGLKGELLGCTILFYTSKKVVAILRDVFANNDDEIAAMLSSTVGELIQALEIEFPGLKVDSYQPARFTSMSVAILDSDFAEFFILSKNMCYMGPRFNIDQSHGRYETESVDIQTALADTPLLIAVEELAKERKRLEKEMEEIKAKLSTLEHQKIDKH